MMTMGNAVQRMVLMTGLAAVAAGPCDARESELARGVGGGDSVRINLNPRGAQIGFENVVPGDHEGVSALVDLIEHAPPGDNHKCPNVGAIRFLKAEGSVLGVGLLPSHSEGLFELRLYDENRYVGVIEVDRTLLQLVLAMLGVPPDEPIMRSKQPRDSRPEK